MPIVQNGPSTDYEMYGLFSSKLANPSVHFTKGEREKMEIYQAVMREFHGLLSCINNPERFIDKRLLVNNILSSHTSMNHGL